MRVGRYAAGVAPLCVVLALAVAQLGAAEAVGVAELWRGSAAPRECRVELVNELGGVRITPSASSHPATVVRGAPRLVIAEREGGESPILSVAWPPVVDGDTADAAADPGGDVELSVAPGCRVSVRTTAGAVTLEVGREALPTVVETLTGDITARVNPASDATVSFATSGEITTDFTVEIDLRYHAEPAKHGTVKLGDERDVEAQLTRVQLTSRRGSVRLLRPPQSERTRTETPDGDRTE